jgi:hypothetical protein
VYFGSNGSWGSSFFFPQLAPFFFFICSDDGSLFILIVTSIFTHIRSGVAVEMGTAVRLLIVAVTTTDRGSGSIHLTQGGNWVTLRGISLLFINVQ